MSKRHRNQDHLAHVPLLSHLRRDDRRAVRDLFTELDVPTGHVLARQGSRASEFLIIVSGTASITRNGIHVDELGPGDFHGEISLLDAGRRAATVTATSATHVMVATQREFIAMLNRFPTIARPLLPELTAQARQHGQDALDYPSPTPLFGARTPMPDQHTVKHNTTNGDRTRPFRPRPPRTLSQPN